MMTGKQRSRRKAAAELAADAVEKTDQRVLSAVGGQGAHLREPHADEVVARAARMLAQQ